MILELTKEEVEAILVALGNLQNATHTYPLAMKVNEQFNAQLQDD